MFLLGGAGVQPVQAQEFTRSEETETNMAYFYYAQPAEATIQVELWGAGQPGLYEVPDGTGLRRLLILAGGVNLGRRQENQKPPRVTVRLYRNDNARDEPILEAQLEEILQNQRDVPQLREDDVVVVDVVQRSRFTWRDGLSIFTTAASLALLILRIIRFSD